MSYTIGPAMARTLAVWKPLREGPSLCVAGVLSISNFDDIAVTDIQGFTEDFQVLISLVSEFFRVFEPDVTVFKRLHDVF